MNLYAKLRERAERGAPVRVGVIGLGKFAAMYLAQVPKTTGVHVVGVADLAPAGARANLERVGWPAQRYAATSLDAALASGATHVGDDWRALVTHPRQPLSREKLMELARGRDLDPFDRAIDVQVSRLRKLVEPDHASPRFIQTVWGHGYVFVPDGVKP